jgi:hypothetical protein
LFFKVSGDIPFCICIIILVFLYIPGTLR